MAVNTHTISIAGTWGRQNTMEQFHDALSWLDWHSISSSGSSDTGYVIGLQTYYGEHGFNVGLDNSVGSAALEFHDVRPVSTTGIGTGLSFYIEREEYSSGNRYAISDIIVNRPGYGYTGGEVVTISAEDIGGSENGAEDLQIPVIIDSDISGGNEYICTLTGTNPVNIEAWDRTGYVSGACTETTVTIQEGDTLKFDNNTGSYNYALVWRRGHQSTNYYYYNEHNRVVGGPNIGVSNDPDTSVFKPISGHAGKYYFSEDNSSTGTIRTFNAANGNVLVTAATSGITTIGIGSTNSWYDQNTHTSSGENWAIWRQSIDENKKFGHTYRIFYTVSNSSIGVIPISDYHPGTASTTVPSTSNSSPSRSGGHGYGKRYCGAKYLDMGDRDVFEDSYISLETTDPSTMDDTSYSGVYHYNGNNITEQLDLNVYRSALDPNFAIFSYKAPNKSASIWSDRNYEVWFYSNYTTNVWDLDDVFLCGVTEIYVQGEGTTEPYLEFRTYIGGLHDTDVTDPSKRSAEYGYAAHAADDGFSQYISTRYYANIVNGRNSSSNLDDEAPRIYFRSTDAFVGYRRNRGGYSSTSTSSNDRVGVDYNPVVKGLPLQLSMIPCPYYLPDDFVLIEFFYSISNQFVDQGDTITISGSEVYTVIAASYYQGSGTTGIAFCARTT